MFQLKIENKKYAACFPVVTSLAEVQRNRISLDNYILGFLSVSISCENRFRLFEKSWEKKTSQLNEN